MKIGSDRDFSPGCRDRLMVASSIASVVVLFVSMLGLARSFFDVTWSLDELGANRVCLQVGRAESDQICLEVGQEEPDLPFAMRVRAAPRLTSQSPRPAAVPDPTITPMPPAPTIAPSATITATIEITAAVVPSTTTDHPFQPPVLLSPEPEAQLQGEIHFQWQRDGEPLPDGLAFDLLIWSEAEHQEHQGTGALGVIETDPSLERDVDLDYVQTIMDHGEGIYYWTVIVVQKEPYNRVGVWGENRPFTYGAPGTEPEPPSESPTPNTEPDSPSESSTPEAEPDSPVESPTQSP
jgi:hypothetical protein